MWLDEAYLAFSAPETSGLRLDKSGNQDGCHFRLRRSDVGDLLPSSFKRRKEIWRGSCI